MTLTRYYEAVRPIAEQIAEEHQTIFRQKLDLGLYAQSPERIEAMKTLKIPTDFKRFQFVLVLIDYNPNSVKFDESNLQGLSFADQVRVFQGGLAMWREDMKSLAPKSPKTIPGGVGGCDSEPENI